MKRFLRVAVFNDYPEEGWPSMDRVARGLLGALACDRDSRINAVAVCPPFRRRVASLSTNRAFANLDRGINRFIDYARHARTLGDRFEVFHIVDHSYAHLVHQLPPGRTVVTCHDLDAFRSVVKAHEEPRPAWFRAMSRHVLSGLRMASCVTCDTAAVREELVGQGIVTPARAVIVPLGVEEGFSRDPDDESDQEARRLVPAAPGAPIVLHVGSTTARKRIDIVLQSFAAMRRHRADLHLARVGGPFTPPQERIARDLDIRQHISVLPPLTDRALAAIYRRAAVLLLPSEREGFGLPVLEAMRCGTPVLARAIPVLREVGGTIATFCDGDEPDRWAQLALEIVRDGEEARAAWVQRRAEGVVWARRFTWAAFASRLRQIYMDVADGETAAARTAAECPA
jgi:glycosyltransferase involved in cell wall biosynthesis